MLLLALASRRARIDSAFPPEVYNYRLGNRSALEWVIDQYRVTEDTRSGIKSVPIQDGAILGPSNDQESMSTSQF